MFCLLKLTVELSIEAKGLLMMRKQGYDLGPSAEVRDKSADKAAKLESYEATPSYET